MLTHSYQATSGFVEDQAVGLGVHLLSSAWAIHRK
jgi:hypothetical protein